MSVPVRATPDARDDIRQAEQYFESRRSGLGGEFVDAALQLLDQLGEMPLMYGEVDPGIRAAGLRRFGYVVYYRVKDDGVEVLAVLHGARSPRAWQDRT